MILKFVSPLSEAEVITLQEALNNGKKPRFRQRAHILLLSHKKYKREDIAKILDVNRDTVSQLINGWKQEGLMCLFDAERSGRPRTYSAAEEIRVKELVDEQPLRVRYARAIIAKETGKQASLDTIKRVIKKNRL